MKGASYLRLSPFRKWSHSFIHSILDWVQSQQTIWVKIQFNLYKENKVLFIFPSWSWPEEGKIPRRIKLVISPFLPLFTHTHTLSLRGEWPLKVKRWDRFFSPHWFLLSLLPGKEAERREEKVGEKITPLETSPLILSLGWTKRENFPIKIQHLHFQSARSDDLL